MTSATKKEVTIFIVLGVLVIASLAIASLIIAGFIHQLEADLYKSLLKAVKDIAHAVKEGSK